MQLPVRTCSGFFSPSSHARGAESWLLSNGRKTSNILKNVEEFNRKFKMREQGRLGRRAEERGSTASPAENKKNRWEKEGRSECVRGVKSG